MNPAVGAGPWTFRGLRLPLLGCLLAGLLIIAAGTILARPGGTSAAGVDPAARVAFERASGLRIERVTVSGAGGLVDVRYSVLDSTKALRSGGPHVVDERSGAVADRPWMGHAHGSDDVAREGTGHYALLLNPGGSFRSGSPVTLVAGDAQLPHLRVR